MLAIQNLSKTYVSDVQTLKSVLLDIEPELSGLLDLNGAGKSSLMRTITILLQPSHKQLNPDTKGVTSKGERKSEIDSLFHQTNLYNVNSYFSGMRQHSNIEQALLGASRSH